MTYATPKTFFNETAMAYFASVTVCVQVDVSGEREGEREERVGERGVRGRGGGSI